MTAAISLHLLRYAPVDFTTSFERNKKRIRRVEEMMKRGRSAEVMRRREEIEDEERGGGSTDNVIATNKKRRRRRRRTTTGRIEELKEKKEMSDVGLAFEDIRLSLLTSNNKSSSISTAAFISISKLLLLVLDKIGPAMVVLRQDVMHNIERLEALFASNPLCYSNLQEILREEREEGTTRKPQSSSRAVVWLTRSIHFSMILMGSLMKDPELSLEQAVEEAYGATFKRWHGWISAAAYKVALKLIPDRTSFINMLLDKKQEQNLFGKDMQNLFSLLQPVLDEIDEHLREFKLEKLKSD